MKDMETIVKEIYPDQQDNRVRSLKEIGYRYAMACNLPYKKEGKKKYFDSNEEFLIKERLKKSVPKPRLTATTKKASLKLADDSIWLSKIIYEVNPHKRNKHFRALDSIAFSYILRNNIKYTQSKYSYQVLLSKEDGEKVKNYLRRTIPDIAFDKLPESHNYLYLQSQNKHLLDEINDKNQEIKRLNTDKKKLQATIKQLVEMLKNKG